MSLTEKAKELANLVKETEEYQNLNSAQARVKLDPTAEDLLNELQSAQQQIQQAQSQGQQVSPEQVEKYQTLESQVQSNLTLTNLVKAQEAFGEMMSEVNETIGKELFGDQQS